MLNNLNNYYVYAQLVQNGTMMIDSSSINMATWQDHYNGILNILKDGIELENVHHMLINICFTKYNNFTVPLYITDYYFNMIMWKAILSIPNLLPNIFKSFIAFNNCFIIIPPYYFYY